MPGLNCAKAASPALLQERAKAGQLHYLESAQAYFDDAGHFREISNLCSYTHPAVWEEKDADGRSARGGPVWFGLPLCLNVFCA